MFQTSLKFALKKSVESIEKGEELLIKAGDTIQQKVLPVHQEGSEESKGSSGNGALTENYLYYKDKAILGTSYISEKIAQKTEEYPTVNNFKNVSVNAVGTASGVVTGLTTSMYSKLKSFAYSDE